MIQAIIFDCFGVLTTDTWRAFTDSLPPGVDVDRARDLNRQYGAGLMSKKEFLRQVKEVTDQSPRLIEEVLDSEVAKNTVLLAYIRELKQTYKIGMLSNVATPWITDSFLTTDEQALFDEMIFSYEVGITKPDPRIFMLACERLRVGPHEAVMVDDIKSYCEAAKREGMHAIWYRDFKQFKQDLERILSHE